MTNQAIKCRRRNPLPDTRPKSRSQGDPFIATRHFRCHFHKNAVRRFSIALRCRHGSCRGRLRRIGMASPQSATNAASGPGAPSTARQAIAQQSAGRGPGQTPVVSDRAHRDHRGSCPMQLCFLLPFSGENARLSPYMICLTLDENQHLLRRPSPGRRL